MANKTYIDGIYVKEIPTEYGGILNITIDIKKFGESIKPHIEKYNDRDQVRISMMKRKEKGQYGDTHYCILNDYKKPETDSGVDNSSSGIADRIKGDDKSQPDESLPF